MVMVINIVKLFFVLSSFSYMSSKITNLGLSGATDIITREYGLVNCNLPIDTTISHKIAQKIGHIAYYIGKKNVKKWLKSSFSIKPTSTASSISSKTTISALI